MLKFWISSGRVKRGRKHNETLLTMFLYVVPFEQCTAGGMGKILEGAAFNNDGTIYVSSDDFPNAAINGNVIYPSYDAT